MFPSLRNFTSANLPSTESFTHCLPKGRRRHLSTCQQIKNCSYRLGYPHSISSSDIVLREISKLQHEHARGFTISSKVFRDGHVELGRHYVRKVVKAQSSFMAEDSLGDLPPIPGPEGPNHQIRALASGKDGQPIDSPMLTNPVSRLNMVRVSILRETPALACLVGKKPC